MTQNDTHALLRPALIQTLTVLPDLLRLGPEGDVGLL